MPDLSARFQLIDEMSSRLEAIANRGQRLVEVFTRVGTAGTSNLERVQRDLDAAARAAQQNAATMSRLQAAMERTSQAQTQLSSALTRGRETQTQVAGSSRVSEEAQRRLSEAITAAETATTELASAQTRAQEAQQHYNELADSGTATQEQLEAAANEAAHAAENLEQAQQRAADATRELSDASEDAENQHNRHRDAINRLGQALAAAGVTKGLKEITDALLACADAAKPVETAFAQLQTIAGSSPMPMLTEQIQQLSNSTGIAQQDLAAVAYNAISAGSAVDEAVGTAEAASKLATAGFTDTNSALSVLSTTMNSYGDSAGSAMEIADSLITVQNLGVTTVAQLSSSMGAAIAQASAFNVNLGNLESAYISLTKAGIGTAEATTYISGMMGELGDSGSDAAAILQEKTGKSFGQLMNEGYSLADVLGILYDSVGQDNEALMNLWGTQTAGLASSAIVNQGLETFNDNLHAVENSAGATESAYSIMANTTEHAQQMLSNSTQNLHVAIGNVLLPVLTKLYEIGAKAFSWAADFVNEHPIVVKAITAITVAIGAAVGIFAAYQAASALATAATALFGGALSTALLPLTAIAAGIAAVAAGVVIFADAMKEDLGPMEGMTATTRDQYGALQDLNSEYEAAKEQYGENSEQALSLKYQVDEMTASYEASKETIEQFTATCDQLCESVSQLSTDNADALNSINQQESGALSLVQRFKELGSQSGWTGDEVKELTALTQKLSDAYPDLDINLTTAKESTEELVQAMVAQCEQQAEVQRHAKQEETYIEALQKQAELREQIAKAEGNVALEEERLSNMGGIKRMFNDDDLKTYQEELQKLYDAQTTNEQTLSDIRDSWAEVDEAINDSSENTISYQEAATTAYQSVQAEVEELAQAYDDVYTSSLQAFESQFGLFEKAQADTEATVANAQAAMDSQLAYWSAYSENISTLRSISAEDLNLTQENYNALMAYVQDGSAEAAGLAQSMVDAVNSGNTQALTELGNTVAQVSEKQQEASATVADWQTDFNSKMDEIEQRMESTIDNLNMSEEAAQSAKSTIESYTKQIRTSGEGAVKAAQDVARRVSSALSSASASGSGGVTLTAPANARGTTHATGAFIAGEKGPELVAKKVSAYATGTTDSDPFYLAGENGPELILGEQGSTVFPASETNRIIDVVSENAPLERSLREAVEIPVPEYSWKAGTDIIAGNASASSQPGNLREADFSELKLPTFPSQPVPAVLQAPEATGMERIFSKPEAVEPVLPVPEPQLAPANPQALSDTGQESGSGEAERTSNYYLQQTENPQSAREVAPNTGGPADSTRTVRIEINGSGAIEVPSSMDREQVLEILQDNLRPVLLNILQSEIYEEGEGTYDF